MTFLDRRALIAGAIAAASLPGLGRAAQPTNATLRYAILRNGKPFGNYSVGFATRGEVLAVVSDVAMSARVAGLTVFNYRHHCEEIWRGGQFAEMRSHSVRDNQSDQEDIVTAVATIPGVKITNKGVSTLLPPASRPFTHWNREALKGPLFNPQNGQPLRVDAAPLGRDQAILASGAKVVADHWAVRGEAQIDEWYDDAGVWVGLKGKLPDRSDLEYRRI